MVCLPVIYLLFFIAADNLALAFALVYPAGILLN
jgi:hypothetical protein|tara:strand:- start:564471 stop:564572 length:102 start_codon:yes stop_codon:yes gene_type:complete